jgi:hypothetical protein
LYVLEEYAQLLRASRLLSLLDSILLLFDSTCSQPSSPAAQKGTIVHQQQSMTGQIEAAEEELMVNQGR